MRASRREFLAITAAGLISAGRPAASQARADGGGNVPGAPLWRQFKGDPQRTGRSNLSGPLNPRLAWHTRGAPPLQSPMSVGSDGAIYMAGDSGVLFAYDSSGQLKWARVVANRYVTAGTAILHDGSILVVPENGLALCFSPTGTFRWAFNLRDYSGPDSAPSIAGNRVIHTGNLTGLYAVNPNGTRRWVFRQRVSGPPAEGPDGTIYFPSDSRLIAVSAGGTLQWSHQSGFSYGLGSAPAVAEDGTIYVTGIQGQLLAVNPNGTRKWIAGVQGTVSDVPSSPALGHDGTIYFSSSYTYVNAAYPDGTLKWSHLTIQDDSFSAPTVCGDGTIYIGAATGKVHAFTPEGDQIWEGFFDNNDPFYYVRSEPVILPAGSLLVGAFDGVFVVAD